MWTRILQGDFEMESKCWYLAQMVEEYTSPNWDKNVVFVNFVMILGESPEDAFQKAMKSGEESNVSYTNSDGDLVTTTFHGLKELYEIGPVIEDGMELFYEDWENTDRSKIASWIPPKSALRAIERSQGVPPGRGRGI